MRRLILLVIVCLVVGQICAPLARASVGEVRPAPSSRAANAWAPQGELSGPRILPQEGFWNRLWSTIVVRIRGWAARFITWLTGTAKDGALLLWERIRWEAAKIGQWLKKLWKWMDFGGGVGPLP